MEGSESRYPTDQLGMTKQHWRVVCRVKVWGRKQDCSNLPARKSGGVRAQDKLKVGGPVYNLITDKQDYRMYCRNPG